MTTTSRILLVIASLAACAVANGAVVELNNGDRISGHIVGGDKNFIHFKSAVFGRISIPRSKIAKIDEHPIVGDVDSKLSLAPVVSISGARLTTAPENQKTATSSKTEKADKSDAAHSQAVANNEPSAAKPEKPLTGRKYVSHVLVSFLRRINYLDKWKSSIRLGYNLYSGETDSFSSTVNFLTERKWKKSECRMSVEQDYATSTNSEGVTSVSRDKLKLSGRYRYNLDTKNRFVQSESEYGYARISGIDQNYLQSFGYGWRMIQTEVWYFCIVPSVSAQYQVIENEQQGVSVAPTMYEEAAYKWTDSLFIHNEAYAIIPANGDNNPTYHFTITLQNKLIGNVSLNIGYVFDFDGSVDESKDAATQSVKASFGIDF